jgi:thioredoxin reductase (NADPH)
MGKPVILVVDDEPLVLRAIERDLRRRYGKEYRVVAAESASAALDALRQFTLRRAPVALLVADQRMPNMTGVEFLAEAVKTDATVKRVLLTAYADTEAAIRAINEVRLDYYLMKPWDPPEDRLYPVLDDLLLDWRASHRPPFEGVRVIGTRWSTLGHTIRDFLARNLIPYEWMDMEAEPEAARLLAATDANIGSLPVVIFPDGSHLVRPSNTAVAEKVGLKVRAGMPFYDVIVVGSGPAGLAAAVYSASEGLRTLVVEREAPGGQAGMSSRIENYLGFPAGLSGADLAHRAVSQAARFGAEILTPQEVTALRLSGNYKILTLGDGAEVSGHAVLVATGVSYRRLDAPGVERLAGAGVFYGAAITEALMVKDGQIYVVGAGNSAGQAAVHLARFARSAHIVVRGESLSETMSHYLVEQIKDTANIHVLTRTVVSEVHGSDHLEQVTLANVLTGERCASEAQGLFIFIGALPRTDWLADTVERDRAGFIKTGVDLLKGGRSPANWPLNRDPYWLETSVPGIFAAGDVRARSIKRIASAVGEGAMAVQFIHQYLGSL